MGYLIIVAAIYLARYFPSFFSRPLLVLPLLSIAAVVLIWNRKGELYVVIIALLFSLLSESVVLSFPDTSISEDSVVAFYGEVIQDSQQKKGRTSGFRILLSAVEDRKGNLFSTDKSVWMQGRCAWMFSRLCNQYGGKEEWLRLAKSCIDFLNAHCIDNADGRMFFTVTEDGRPLRKRRYYFSETFYIMANAEYAKASGDVQALKNAQKYYDFVLNIYADPSVDPYKITPKVIDSTRKSRTLAPSMILLNVSAVMRECDPQNAARYDTVSKSLAEDIVRYFYKPELGVTLENVGYEGEVLEDIASFRVVNPGHSIEMSWFLLDEAIRSGNSSLAETAEKRNGCGWRKVA